MDDTFLYFYCRISYPAFFFCFCFIVIFIFLERLRGSLKKNGRTNTHRHTFRLCGYYIVTLDWNFQTPTIVLVCLTKEKERKKRDDFSLKLEIQLGLGWVRMKILVQTGGTPHDGMFLSVKKKKRGAIFQQKKKNCCRLTTTGTHTHEKCMGINTYIFIFPLIILELLKCHTIPK